MSRSLSRLCNEVMLITDDQLDRRITVEGKGEVAQVAAAINRLLESLSENVHGMRQMLVYCSHEMRSPLTRMNVALAIIEDGLVHEGKLLENAAAHNKMELSIKYLRNLQKEIDHMEQLIGSSLLTSKLILQRQELQMEPFVLSELCEEIISRHEPLLHSKKIDFTKKIQSNLCVRGDAVLLSIVISNLLDNAVKYTDEGGKVHCSLCMEQGMAQLNVENSHHALSDKDLVAVFEPFYRGLGTGNDNGVGLGLALVKRIVDIHKGSVSAENSKLGLLFTIKLSLVQRAN